MDVLAECKEPAYVRNVYAIHPGSEPIEYDAFPGYNGLVRHAMAGDYGYTKLFDWNCDGISAQYSTGPLQQNVACMHLSEEKHTS